MLARLRGARRRAFLVGAVGAALVAADVPRSGADELRNLYYSSRVSAMGGAYLGLSDGQESLYLNPAGLADGEDIEIHLAPIDVSASLDILSVVTDNPFAGEVTASTFNALMGRNIAARAQLTPHLYGPNFGLGIIADQQLGLLQLNRALPKTVIGYQTTTGAYLGGGFSFEPKSGGRRRRRRSSIGGAPTVSIGAAAKLLSRRGGYRTLGLANLVAADADMLTGIMGDWGMGYGADLGLHLRAGIGRAFTLGLGAAWLDVGDTWLGEGPDPQRNNLGVGTSLTWTTGIANVSVLYDLHHLTQEADIRKKNHMGVELRIPGLAIYTGLNQLRYLSYGVGFNLWFFEVTALRTSEELGTFVGQQPNARYSLRADLKIKI